MNQSRRPAEPARHLTAAILAVVIGAGLAGWTGCQRSENQTPGGTSGTATVSDSASAKEVLDAMVAAYKKAQKYSDHGVLRLTATVDGQKQERNAPYSVAWERPNKLRMHAMDGVVVCDGKQFHAHYQAMDDQVAQRPAPAQLDIPFLLSDMIFSSAISDGGPSQFALVPPQTLLLMTKDPLKTLCYRSQEPTLLVPGKLPADKGEIECHRVELDRPDGKAILWIDRQTAVLRRIELPIEQLKKDAAQEKVQIDSWIANFVDAQFDGSIDQDQFQIEVPASMKVVEYLTPSPLLILAKPAPEFHFVGMDGKPVDRAALQGKIAAMEFWNTACDPCQTTMPLLEKVYQKYKDNPKVLFLAVSVDEKTVPDKDVQAKLAQWQATLPIVRDPDLEANKKFGIRPIPAMVLVGANGTVQDYSEGVRQTLDVDLTAKIENLLAGQDITRDPLRRWDDDRAQYGASLKRWADHELYVTSPPETPETPETPEVKPAEPTSPKTFSLVPLWKSPDVNSPGNLLVIPGSEPGGASASSVRASASSAGVSPVPGGTGVSPAGGAAAPGSWPSTT